MKRLVFILLLVIGYGITIACKSARLGPEYPITDFSEYDCIVIATVDKATHHTTRYNPLNTFYITIKKTLKGKQEIGKRIHGKAKKEQPRAVCPVHLDEQSDYLLLLTKSGGTYKLSRFSFPVKKDSKYFDNYIKQIEKILSKKEKN